ncbi:MAG: SDR family oxidoreductase [Methyloprofundus sp.]|nr:SDR family oxidoreductase [Methyloprofundus sp.]
MKAVLITGANRGLGLEFCLQYAQAGWQVFAGCRDVQNAQDLNHIAEEYDNVQVVTLDVSKFEHIDSLAFSLYGVTLDLLISNAGVYGDSSGHGFGAINYDDWRHTLDVNVLSAIKLAEAFKESLAKSDAGLFVAISSLMGSVADNGSGGSILYRSSKAALNAAMKSLSFDIKPAGVGVLIFHPGWVRTDMGGPNGLCDAPESIAGMRQQIKAFTMQKTGQFIKYDGTEMPW